MAGRLKEEGKNSQPAESVEQPFSLHGAARFLISRFFLIFPALALHSELGMGHRGHLSSVCTRWVLNPLKGGKSLFSPVMFAGFCWIWEGGSEELVPFHVLEL